ncbi:MULTISPECIES: alkaline phosphatase family protein [unclassified Rhizobacter]|uniref:alkaline phosphatase family protein n=1 Tax=unclassified Rhizobacter TaxID=2640088 RepID=UPI0006FAB9AB|nr:MULTISPECIES: alkaline phosphatase family protein [unclassified Rhizobacter]KQU77159.1 hypothetical protein ASC88_22560 [Rhizobacter sp. Root29]KQW12767.1 hypothetical protein ASC98_19520 [Rhizobacter sp. Root1238]KRB22355.1 hypothetical protein ASE08_21270 [Rhizobacter sp. Root16D2]
MNVESTSSLGNLYWYRHDGWEDGTERWTGRNLVGQGGWQAYKSVFATSGGILYAIDWDGNLHWYRDNGWTDGTERWELSRVVGRGGWAGYRTVFATSDGILYAADFDGNLYWYRHDGWQDGSERWSERKLVGRGGWGMYASLCATSDGVLYGVTPDGDLEWYRHDGWQDGSERWTGKQQVGNGGWDRYASVFATSDGRLYGTTPDGNLYWYHHVGWRDGSARWAGGNLVGRGGWDGYANVFMTSDGILFGVDNNVASRVKHIVYLMLENRSLDNVLGWLYADGQRPDRVMAPPDNNAPDFNGLHPETFYNLDPQGVRHWVTKGTKNTWVPECDPNEDYTHVTKQLFGRHENPPRGEPAGMGGFYNDFVEDSWRYGHEQIMQTYTPAELPVLNGAARHYAVSDAYFASVPTQTNCNRAFAATGNSLAPNPDAGGALQAWVDNNMWFEGTNWLYFNQRTMFNVMSDAGMNSTNDWMVFASEAWTVMKKWCFTRDILTQLGDSKFDPHFDMLDAFLERARNGKLPTVSFLEPSWGYGYTRHGIGKQGTDYHPPENVAPGEDFVATLLNALRSGPQWNETLLIINFDEHGGTYDHVAPPWKAAVPWGGESATPPPTASELGFGFDRFGVRVPLILVSPYIEPNTVFRARAGQPFDHTSVIATILKMMGIPRSEWQLGNRVANAPTFESVLTRSVPRTDMPPIEPSAAAQAAVAAGPTIDPPPSGLQLEIASRLIRHCLSLQAQAALEFQPSTVTAGVGVRDDAFASLGQVKKVSELAALVERAVRESSPPNGTPA